MEICIYFASAFSFTCVRELFLEELLGRGHVPSRDAWDDLVPVLLAGVFLRHGEVVGDGEGRRVATSNLASDSWKRKEEEEEKINNKNSCEDFFLLFFFFLFFFFFFRIIKRYLARALS